MNINSTFIQIIDHSILNNKLQQVYLLSCSTLNNFDNYLIEFINRVNHENFYKWNEIIFGDLYFCIDGSQKTISKQEVLDAMKLMNESNSNHNNKYKFLIIKNIENGTAQTLNSLLKFLENPPANLIVLMTTKQKSSVLKTIKSRAFLIDIKNTITLDEPNAAYTNYFILNNIDNENKKDDLIKLFSEFEVAIIASYKYPEQLLAHIATNMNKDNYAHLINFIKLIYQDILKYNIGNNDFVILRREDLKRKTFTNFSAFKAIEAFDEMLKSVRMNCNFNLQKAALIVNLEMIYGI
ncbi:DNA polymerase III [Metamycoplasma neophronis]|uniref:DNA polymerase III n=1 Tax=Metamycoplasma neophronis TaxID=872983 RepID=A0ABY2YZB5_9BACT|nr:DNA polymerase III [Metamycoplasma neophronis]TPR53369.1 DNA polymerase III [Metamycoplasma neophronis]